MVASVVFFVEGLKALLVYQQTKAKKKMCFTIRVQTKAKKNKKPL